MRLFLAHYFIVEERNPPHECLGYRASSRRFDVDGLPQGYFLKDSHVDSEVLDAQGVVNKVKGFRGKRVYHPVRQPVTNEQCPYDGDVFSQRSIGACAAEEAPALPCVLRRLSWVFCQSQSLCIIPVPLLESVHTPAKFRWIVCVNASHAANRLVQAVDLGGFLFLLCHERLPPLSGNFTGRGGFCQILFQNLYKFRK